MDYIERAINKVAVNKKSHFWLFFAILVLLTSLMMYLYKPSWVGHDFYFHYRRLQALMEALADGNFFLTYLDYSAANGYGYFTKAFYSDVTLIPFALVGNFTSDLFAYRTLIFTVTILCGVFTYNAVNSVYKSSFAASVSALLYTFCAYRILDIFARVALGEFISFTFVPLVFLGLYHIIRGDYKKWYILTIGFSLMIFTHLISSVLMFVTLVIFLFIYNKSLRENPKRIGYLFLSGVVTLLLTAYYIFPMLEQMLSSSFYYDTRVIMSKAEDATSELHWIIWGMFTGVIQPRQAFIPGIGILLTFVVLLRLFVHEKSKQLKSMDIFLILGLFYMFAISSFFPWKYFPFNLLNFIQLPWRLYEFISFFFAVAGAYYLSSLLKTNTRRLLGSCLLVLLITFSFLSDSLVYKERKHNSPIIEEATLNNNYHLGGLEYFPSKLPSLNYIHARGEEVVIVNGIDANPGNLAKQNGITTLDLETNGFTILELPLVYYKGYKAIQGESVLTVSESMNGLVQLETSQTGEINVYYAGTAVQIAGWFISIATIFLLSIYVVIGRSKKEKIVT